MPYPVAAARQRPSGGKLSYFQRVKTDGASFYLPLSENAGSPTVTDAIGGLVGTVSGGVTLGVTGPLTGEAVNRAALFSSSYPHNSATDGYLRFANPGAVVDANDSFWAEAWVKLTAPNWAARSIEICQSQWGLFTEVIDPARPDYPIIACWFGTGFIAGFDVAQGALVPDYAPDLEDDMFHHFVMVADRVALQLRLYLDTVLIAQQALDVSADFDSVAGDEAPIWVGCEGDNNSSTASALDYFTNGAITQCAFGRGLLSPAQIAAHAAYGGL